jgi:hypothetical protein
MNPDQDSGANWVIFLVILGFWFGEE